MRCDDWVSRAHDSRRYALFKPPASLSAYLPKLLAGARSRSAHPNPTQTLTRSRRRGGIVSLLSGIGVTARKRTRMTRCGPCFTALVALLALLAAVLLRPDGSQAVFVRGLHAYENGDLHTAHDAFAQCVSSSRRLDCRSNLATVLAALGSREEAVKHFRAVLAVEPNHADAAFNLAGLLHAQAGGVPTAEEAHLRGVAAKAAPSQWELWAQFASALTAINQAPPIATRANLRAITELQRSHGGSKEEDGHLTELYYALGIQLSELESAECTDLASELSVVLGTAAAAPGCAAAARGSGGSACDAHALEAYQKALALDPAHMQSEHMRAAICDGARVEAHTGRGQNPLFVQVLLPP